MAKQIHTPGVSRQHLLHSLWPAILIGLMLLLPQAHAESSGVTSGHSAHWFSPERAGEGLVLEIMSPELALLYWFTYDEQGNQRWLTNVGHIDGERIVFDELLVTRGGRFGPDFDPSQVEVEVVGQAELVFSDCDNLVFSYSAFDQSESIDMIRLTQTMAAGCQPLHGVPGEPVHAYAGQSGSWYDQTHAGEGYTLQWMSRDQAVLIWFSYDGDGNQYWMIGTGELVDDQIHFGMLHSAQGGRFGEDFDSSEVELIEWGSLVLELDCMTGTAAYESLLPEFGAGSLHLDRLSFLQQPACPWTQPKLTDLYDIVWTEIPIGENDRISAASIADNGVVAGVRRSNTTPTGEPATLELWRPDLQSWQSIPGEINGRLRVSKDGESVLSVRRHPPFQTIPVLWHQDTGWEPLSGLIYDLSYPDGVSRDLSQIVGQGFTHSDNLTHPWIWDAENGQRPLPTTEEITGGSGMGVSNDGTIVVGDLFAATFYQGFPGVGITWTNEQDPELLRNNQNRVLGAAQHCNHDCSVVTGYGHPDYYVPGEDAWFKTNKGQFGFLGTIDEAVPFTGAYVPMGISSDGTLIIGRYLLRDEDDALTRRGFIWTQNTGIVSVRELIEDNDIGDDNWSYMLAFSLTSDGSRILLTGAFPSDGSGEWDRTRAVVLELSAKE